MLEGIDMGIQVVFHECAQHLAKNISQAIQARANGGKDLESTS